MKIKNMLRLLMFAAILIVPAAVFGQGSGSSERPSDPRPPATSGIRDDNNFEITRSVSGTIVGVEEGILTIKTEKDKEVRVALFKGTKYKLGKKKLDADELSEELFKEGKSVKITYKPFQDNKNRFDKVALEVRFDDDGKKEKPGLG